MQNLKYKSSYGLIILKNATHTDKGRYTLIFWVRSTDSVQERTRFWNENLMIIYPPTHNPRA